MYSQAIPLSQFVPTQGPEIQKVVHESHTIISNIRQKGGPDQLDYPILNTIFQQFTSEAQHNRFSEQHLQSIREAFGESLSTETIQGWAFKKPLGYAGDYQIIERIYNYYTAENPNLSKWDHFFHAQKAPQAVRNRLSFFLDRLWKTKNSHPGHCDILNLASGPGRDMYEAMKALGPGGITIDCVEQDLNAIDHAKKLCQEFLSCIQFIHKNIFRFMTTKKYHLIWSAGLFDYFNDNVFKRTIARLIPLLQPNGKIVIGNFSTSNPNKGYMDLCQWNLFHRSKQHLRRLAEECGFLDHQVQVEQEPEGINLFLVMTKN